MVFFSLFNELRYKETGMKVLLIAFIVLSRAFPSESGEFPLVKDNAGVSSVVLTGSAGPVEKHAANELSLYLGKISGGADIRVLEAPSDELYNIYLGTFADEDIVKMVDSRAAAAAGPEGFVLSAGPGGVVVLGKNPIGVLYGVYEILKEYGGIRWITPGEDGEYFSIKPEITVPAQTTVHNPSFRWRRIFFGSCNANSFLSDSWDWMVRNNMRLTKSYRGQHDREEIRTFLEERGAVGDEIGAFSRLLGGIFITRGYREGYEHLAEMFKEYPERFPLINGERVPLTGNQRFQPCTTNPDVIEIMRDNIDIFLSTRMHPGDEFTVFNDDGTGWCQCDNCVKLDPEDERDLRFVSTRYWIFINELLGPLAEKHPEINLGAIAYQNFQRVPSAVEPDENLYVLKAYNRRCYRHNLDDPDCPVNSVFYEYFRQWSQKTNPSFTWEQIDASAARYMPTEHTFINQLKIFHELGINGARPVVSPPDGTYGERYDGTMTRDNWYGMWQTMYLSALFHWDIERDYDEIYREASALYYADAWPFMEEYRRIMVETVTGDPGCYGWGHGTPVGRLLSRPGVHERMKQLLNSAEAAVKDDPRASLHVSRDREFFTRVWEKKHAQYMDDYRELRAYRKKGQIKIDGELDESDWKNADIITGFKTRRPGAPEQIAQTFVRMTYDPDSLYFAIEAMEPSPDEMLTRITRRDGDLWLDNTLEIFITHPDLAGDYFHLIFNADGVLYDAFNRRGQQARDVGFDSQAEIKTKVLEDRWIAEVRVPTAPMGMQAFDGQVWRINVARGRVLKNDYRETSSWSGGAFHDVEYFPSVSFAGGREISRLSFIEKDTRFWKNGGFNEVVRRDPRRGPGLGWTIGENELLPKDWILQEREGKLEMVEDSYNTYFLLLKEGKIFQFNRGMEKNYSINMRVKGRGVLKVWIYNYPRLGETDQIDQEARRRDGVPPSKMLGEISVNSKQWQDYSFKYSKADAMHISALAFHLVDGEIGLNDVYMTPAAD